MPAALLGAVEDANQKVLSEATLDPKLEGMGTTLVAVLETSDNDVAIASVGDSRGLHSSERNPARHHRRSDVGSGSRSPFLDWMKPV